MKRRSLLHLRRFKVVVFVFLYQSFSTSQPQQLDVQSHGTKGYSVGGIELHLMLFLQSLVTLSHFRRQCDGSGIGMG